MSICVLNQMLKNKSIYSWESNNIKRQVQKVRVVSGRLAVRLGCTGPCLMSPRDTPHPVPGLANKQPPAGSAVSTAPALESEKPVLKRQASWILLLISRDSCSV